MLSSISEINKTKFDVDESGKMKRKVMLRKLTKITAFHVSTQTTETAANLTPIHPANWIKDFKSLSIDPGYPTDSNPKTLAQPFIGFIRKNEKIYARENGLMRIALREFKRIYDQIQMEIENILQHHRLLHVIISEKLNQVLFKMQDNNWLFDPSYFVQKVSMNPLEDPIDAATQTRLISSYMTAQNEVEKKLQLSTANNKELKEVHVELGRLLVDLNARRKSSGGWRSILYNADGSMNLEMDLEGYDNKEKIDILQEKLKYVQMKSADKERQQNITIQMQQDTIFELKQDINSKKGNSNSQLALNVDITFENNSVKKTRISKLKNSSPSVSPSSSVDNVNASQTSAVPTIHNPTVDADINAVHVNSTIRAYENSLHTVLSTLHMVYSTLMEKNKQLDQHTSSNKYDKHRNIISVDAENSFYSSSSAAILDSYREDITDKAPSSKHVINTGLSPKIDVQLINTLEKKISNTSKHMNRDYISSIISGNSKRPLSSISPTKVPLLRITKSLNTPIDHKHLLVRPQTANPISSLDKSSKGFASIMTKSMIGNKPPLDAYRLLEAQNRQEKAKQQIAEANNHQPNNINKFQGGLHPNTTYTDVIANKSPQASPPRNNLARTFSGPSVTIPEIVTRDPAKQLVINEEMSINSLEDLDKSLIELDKNTSNSNNETKSYASYSLIREVSEMCQRLIDDFALSLTNTDVVYNTTSNNQLLPSDSERPQAIGIGESLLDQETNSQYSNNNYPTETISSPSNHIKYGSVYENLFANININSKDNYTSASDVSNYVTITKDKLDHYKKEVSKLENILKSIGNNRNNTSNDNHNDPKHQTNQFSHVQELASTHYANNNIYRPQSAAPIVVHAIQINHPPRARTANSSRKLKDQINNNNSAISFNDSRYSEENGSHRHSRVDDETIFTNFNEEQQMSLELSNLSEYEVV